MKWRDLKNLSPEERKEMRRAVAKTTSDQISYLKKLKYFVLIIINLFICHLFINLL